MSHVYMQAATMLVVYIMLDDFGLQPVFITARLVVETPWKRDLFPSVPAADFLGHITRYA